MKRIIISVALCIWVVLLSAQTIVEAEYFFDNDPGFGLATSIAITAGSTIDEDLSADISSLSDGFHMLYIRLKDSDGNWSLVQNRPIFKNGTNATNEIVAGEIFFDNDPGFGMATPFVLTQGASIVEDPMVNISSLSNGFHMMYIRIKDSDGDWSLAQNRPFYKFGTSAVVTITEAEVFFDSDPGFGNGTQLNINTGINIDEDLSVDISNLSDGIHMMYIRVKDNDGFWGLVENRPFFKSGNGANPNIIAYEYFVDNDPGYDSATTYNSFTPAQIQTSDFSIDLSTVLVGNHYLYIRALDDQGNWSMVANMPFEKTTCGNGIKDGDEEFVDCGGSKCIPCTDCSDINRSISDDPMADQLYIRANNMIDSDGGVGANTFVIFQAGNSILLKPEFEVKPMATFEAIIDPCDN